MGVEGGDCGDYTDSKQLMNAYTTNVKENAATEIAAYQNDIDEEKQRQKSGEEMQSAVLKKLKLGERTPSYTDRVLYHSLPGYETSITPGSYELCDHVVMSDHRPVCATFNIAVDEKISPVGGDGGGEGGESLYKSVDREAGRVVFRLSFSDIRVNNKNDDLEYDVVQVLFPLPNEDVLLSQRKVHALAGAMTGLGGMGGDDESEFVSRSGETATMTSRALMNSTEKGLRGEIVTIISETNLTRGFHAGLKIVTGGEIIGMGLIDMSSMLPELHRRGTATKIVEADLSLGGGVEGAISCNLTVDEMFLQNGDDGERRDSRADSTNIV